MVNDHGRANACYRFNFALSHWRAMVTEAGEMPRRRAVRIISLKDNPHRWESLLNLTKAFYYGGGYYFFQGENRPSQDDSTLTRFL